jgi:hypothetical protein
MAKKKVEVEVDIETNVEGSIAQLKELKKQLKLTAAGSEEFKKLYSQIDDLEDKIKSGKNVSKDWVDTLEGAGGPLGMLGKTINSLKVSTVSFGTALKATGIGLLVSTIGLLVGAFSKSETAMKSLQPLMIQLEKLFNGLVTALQPLLDVFIQLAIKILPVITKGIAPNGEINFEFVPDNEADDAAARQATNMVHKLINQNNDPHTILQHWVMHH